MTERERRIALVDDHRMFADGFGVLLASLRPGYQVQTFDEPVVFLRRLEAGETFDLAILDLVMRSMNGLAVLAAMRERKSRTPVLIISGIGTEPPLAEMRALGARGFVHKTADTDTLIDATDTILAGRSFFPAASDQQPEGGDDAGEFDAHLITDGLPALAPRQLEILHLIGRGETNKAVAATLKISENTVKSHLRAIFEALGAHTRTACVRKAQALGLI